jgi:polyhydroxybutyrate depolymerase
MLFVVIFSQAMGEKIVGEEISTDSYIHSNGKSIFNGKKLNFMFFDGRIRSYFVHIPPSYDGETEVPMLILLHGGTDNGLIISKQSDMDAKADDEGFIAVYPNGAQGLFFPLLNRLLYGKAEGRWWNVEYCGLGPRLLNIDDVGFIDSIIERMQKEYSINSSRIYIAGFSNGAMLTYYAGAKLSHKIAAIAPVAGTIGGSPNAFRPIWTIPKPMDSVSAIIFHGFNDKIFLYEGGTINPPWGVHKISVNDSVKFWVDHNDCNSTPKINISENGNVTSRTYVNGTNGSEVVLYTVLNGEHWWFGGSWEEGEDYDSIQEISATDLIWEFFEKHPKV